MLGITQAPILALGGRAGRWRASWGWDCKTLSLFLGAAALIQINASHGMRLQSLKVGTIKCWISIRKSAPYHRSNARVDAKEISFQSKEERCSRIAGTLG